MKIPFLGGAYTGRSTNVSPQECINFFYERTQDEEALVSTPGASVFNSDYTGEVRGGISYADKAFFVIANKLISLDSLGNSTEEGELLTSSGRVSMAHNGTRPGANQHLIIVDGSYGYIYDNTNQTLTQITDTDFPRASIVKFIDGYFIVNKVGTDQFQYSDLYDGFTWDGLDFITAEGDPDEIVGMEADQRQLIIGGEITTSMYYNSGDVDNAFERYQGGYTQTGLAAAHSLQRMDNSVIWLSRNERGDAMVVRPGEGVQPTVISTPEVNYQLSQYTRVDDAFAYVYQEEGNEFYVLTFPTEGVTWSYNATNQLWHKRGHTINGQLSRERYNCHIFVFGKHLLGDFENGKIYELDSSLGTIDGERIERIRISGEVSNKERRTRLASVQLDMEVGFGEPSEEDTLVWLSYSKNGGHTYSSESPREAGDKGEFSKRLIWRRLGHSRNWIFKIRTWSPHALVIKDLIPREYAEDDTA